MQRGSRGFSSLLHLSLFALASMCAPAVGAAPAAQSPAPLPVSAEGAEMESTFGAFYTSGLDIDHPLAVENLRVEKDSLIVTLRHGTIYLTRPLLGEVIGAYFVGEGLFNLSPPSSVERKALKRRYGKETVDEPFSEAVFRFDDGTDKTLQAGGKPMAAPGAEPAIWQTRGRVDYNSDDLQMDFLESRYTDGPRRAFFVLAVNTQAKGWINFNYRDRSRIENSLFDEKSGAPVARDPSTPGVCSTRSRTTMRRDITRFCRTPTARILRRSAT